MTQKCWTEYKNIRNKSTTLSHLQENSLHPMEQWLNCQIITDDAENDRSRTTDSQLINC